MIWSSGRASRSGPGRPSVRAIGRRQGFESKTHERCVQLLNYRLVNGPRVRISYYIYKRSLGRVQGIEETLLYSTLAIRALCT
jgi:hypothetical protein